MKLLHVLYALCAAVFVVDVIALLAAGDRHVEHPLEHLPGFYGAWGFLAIVVLVLVSKGLRRLVLRREEYFDE
jgi:hypothetical protein